MLLTISENEYNVNPEDTDRHGLKHGLTRTEPRGKAENEL
jgi:hypothetical protein